MLHFANELFSPRHIVFWKNSINTSDYVDSIRDKAVEFENLKGEKRKKCVNQRYEQIM